MTSVIEDYEQAYNEKLKPQIRKRRQERETLQRQKGIFGDTIETSDKSAPSTSKSKKTLENRQRIMEYLKDHGRSKCADIAGFLGLSAERTRAILSEMPEVESMGSNRH